MGAKLQQIIEYRFYKSNFNLIVLSSFCFNYLINFENKLKPKLR